MLKVEDAPMIMKTMTQISMDPLIEALSTCQLKHR